MQPKLLFIVLPVLIFQNIFHQSIAQGIVINDGGNIVVNGNASIVINDGHLNNSGTFTPATGTVLFTGTNAVNISGNSTTSFYNLSMDKSGAGITLMQNASVAGALAMVNGNLDLNSYNLDLGTTGSVTGERAVSRILGPAGGFLIRTTQLSSPAAVNPGNIGVSITSSANLGTTIIKRGHEMLQLAGGYSANRFFDIAAAGGTGNNTVLNFSYFDEELNTVAEKELGVYYIPSSAATQTLLTTTAFDSVADNIQVSNAALAGRFVLASNISDPARSSDLVAVLDGDKADLSWTSFYEINTDHYELERAVDKSYFAKFATITAAGSSSSIHNYTYTDPEPVTGPYEVPSPRYYRYKLIFKDGTYRYSNIASVGLVGYNNQILHVYPNPTTGPVTVSFSSNKNQRVVLQVTDNYGNVVSQKQMDAITGPNLISADISGVMPGVYYLRLLNIGKNAYKIIKQ